MDRLFADTYALIEILKGSESYQRHAMCELVTTEFNLLELAYALLRDFREDDVETILGRVHRNVKVQDSSQEKGKETLTDGLPRIRYREKVRDKVPHRR